MTGESRKKVLGDVLGENGEMLATLQDLIMEKCETLGKGAERLREVPEELMHEKAELEERLRQIALEYQQLQRSGVVEVSGSAETDMVSAQLRTARDEAKHREAEIERLKRELKVAQEEQQTSREIISDLRRTLADERRELNNIRQERFLTSHPHPPRVSRISPPFSPRQLEHPELAPPRLSASCAPPSAAMTHRPGVPRTRAASASPRTVRTESCRPPRPTSAAPTRGTSGAAGELARETAAVSTLGWASATAADDVPNLSAPFAEFASVRSGAMRGASGGGVRAANACGRAADAATQTSGGLAAEGRWQERARELQQANDRLQTALLAAALDHDGGELGAVLSAVTRTNSRSCAASSSPRSKPPGATRGAQSARTSCSSRQPRPPSNWGTSATLPRGLTAWPPMA